MTPKRILRLVLTLALSALFVQAAPAAPALDSPEARQARLAWFLSLIHI